MNRIASSLKSLRAVLLQWQLKENQCAESLHQQEQRVIQQQQLLSDLASYDQEYVERLESMNRRGTRLSASSLMERRTTLAMREQVGQMNQVQQQLLLELQQEADIRRTRYVQARLAVENLEKLIEKKQVLQNKDREKRQEKQ